MKRLFNPCDECRYNHSKANQENGMCRICEFGTMIKLEKQGKLLELPCRIGDPVYKIGLDGEIELHKVASIEIGEKGIYFISGRVFCGIEDFGRRVFFTKEDAEAARGTTYSGWFQKK